jgi:hypothetical protein
MAFEKHAKLGLVGRDGREDGCRVTFIQGAKT